MENLLAIAVGMILVNNIVLTRFLGLCSFFGVSRRIRDALGMGIAVTFVMTCSAAITWFVYEYLLVPAGIQYMRIVVFILVIASFVQMVEVIVRKKAPSLYRAMGIYLPLITTNCAILGVVLINTEVERYSFVASTVSGFSAGIGYALAILLMAGIKERLEIAEIPESFRESPIGFIIAALLAMVFMGFGGMV
ncbi:MAG: RnfABCDGE type electron transport complex subunit A [Candidatus Hadarchaeales archaeon]